MRPSWAVLSIEAIVCSAEAVNEENNKHREHTRTRGGAAATSLGFRMLHTAREFRCWSAVQIHVGSFRSEVMPKLRQQDVVAVLVLCNFDAASKGDTPLPQNLPDKNFADNNTMTQRHPGPYACKIMHGEFQLPHTCDMYNARSYSCCSMC